MRAIALALAMSVGALSCAPALTPIQQAELRISRGEVAGATRDLEHLRDAHPEDPRTWVALGHAYELGHRYDDALISYDRAAEIAPADPIGPHEGGLRAAAWGDHVDAIARLREAIRRGDDDPSIYHALGVLLLDAGDLVGAEAAYRGGLATPRGDRDPTCVLGLASVAVARGDGAAALVWYDELLRRVPSSASIAELGRAWAFGTLGRIADADAALDAAQSAGATTVDLDRLRSWLHKPDRH